MESAFIFNTYLLIICSRIVLPQVVCYAKHKHNVLMYSSGVELIVNLTLSLMLVSSFGLVGIAFATVLAFFVNKLIIAIYVHHRLGVSMASYIKLNEWLFWSIMQEEQCWIDEEHGWHWLFKR